jgi:hypothetical protein
MPTDSGRLDDHDVGCSLGECGARRSLRVDALVERDRNPDTLA